MNCAEEPGLRGAACPRVILGFDPGGKTNKSFAWAILQDAAAAPLLPPQTGRADHAEDAFQQLSSRVGTNLGSVVAVGVDSPLTWVPDDARQVDAVVRAQGATALTVNSLQGSCIAQGPMIARLVHDAWSEAQITEAHPKASLFVWPNLLSTYFDVWSPSSEHERDAAIAAVAAWAMRHNDTRWQDIGANCDSKALWPLLSHRPAYWFPLPTSARQGSAPAASPTSASPSAETAASTGKPAR